ncbi:type I secretion protein [Pseudooceanicola sediminis]|uniref:Type I secretion protein n=1 Tax=Pseudooceanicola sediminis TaxID=2211117 RepID=A0A399J5L0_9RHOB|nr:Hint domain-containing protein [Pseudooceanicola sediminis]KAA2317265.1 type I secretion protein [Puniceibacterium sp. HSS470]RII39619.1 type I secretion protein [Pseudooceanicola sediminis]|tara:strand:- start:17104 stop:18462 length:1359 start_codon:yes stop_codon:yes gene_type:complete
MAGGKTGGGSSGGRKSGDTISGTDRDDTLSGGRGADHISGGNGRDVLHGGAGNDTLLGEGGEDKIFGDSGDDFIDGGQSRDTISGGSGNDQVSGGDGEDLIYGDDGDDTLDGGQGQDTLYGGAGNDVLSGGDTAWNKGVDVLYGGDGDDTLSSNGNQDQLYGEQGSDTFTVIADGSNLNNLSIDGGEDWDNTDQDVLDLSQYTERYPDLQIIYEQGGPTTESGQILLKTGSGQELGRINYSNIEVIRTEPAVICFAPGTLIATIKGEVPVEELRPGARVITRDNGMQQLRWIGRRSLTAAELAVAPHLRPIRIRAGALGRGLPDRDLTVSPNHRMLIRSERASLLYEESEVLIAAKHLVGMPGVERVVQGQVVYLHLLFDQHEVILANGAWSESFQPGDYSMKGLADDQRSEVYHLFPELAEAEHLAQYSAARRSLKQHEVKVLRAGNGVFG